MESVVQQYEVEADIVNSATAQLLQVIRLLFVKSDVCVVNMALVDCVALRSSRVCMQLVTVTEYDF
jgi:hypothetical protein